jgi:hypothetical protein
MPVIYMGNGLGAGHSQNKRPPPWMGTYFRNRPLGDVTIQNKKAYKQGVCHMVALPLTLKSILIQKKNYGNSNISPCKNIILKKNQNPSRHYNSETNFKFQHKPKYHLSKILI